MNTRFGHDLSVISTALATYHGTILLSYNTTNGSSFPNQLVLSLLVFDRFGNR